MRALFTILQTIIHAIGTFIIGILIGLEIPTAIYISLGILGLTIFTNLLFRIRRFDGILHLDTSKETAIIQLEFCADPRRFDRLSEVYFKVDTETDLRKETLKKNELVEKALDEIEEFRKV